MAPFTVRLRQIAICAPDIWPVEREVIDKLQIATVHRDRPQPTFWMSNAVMPVGDTFLEILQPERDEAPTRKFLEKQGGAAGYMLLLQVSDLDAARQRVDSMNIRVVHAAPPAERNGIMSGGIHLHPADTRGVLTSLDWMEDWDEWAWAGTTWHWHRREDVVNKIVAAEISSAEPDQVAERFARLLDRPVGPDREIALDEGVLRFVAAPADQRDRLTGIDMQAADRSRAGERFEFCRTLVRLV